MKLTKFRCTRMVVLAGITCLAFACGRSTVSMDEMRLRYKEKITGGDNPNLTDSLVIKRLASMDKALEASWSTLNKEPNRTYLWNTRNCADDTISPFRPTSITTPIGIISSMSVTYATKGSKYYQNPELKQDIIDAMEWIYANKWSPQHPLYGNWWDWIIGMPYSVNNMLVAMYDDFTPEQRTKYVEALDFYAPDVTYRGASTGANKIWQCVSMSLRGIISHNPDKIKMGVDGINTEFKYVSVGDGFYDDGSYVQHEWHPYTGGYGAGMLRDVTNMIMLVDGSEWAVSQENVDMTYGWVNKAYMPLIYKGAMMDMVRGREIAREAASDRGTGHGLVMTTYLLSKMASPQEKAHLQSWVKYNILNDSARNFIMTDVPTYMQAEMEAFVNDPAIPAVAPEPFHKQFSMMDRTVHVRPGFALGLAVSSSRIENYESIDTENMKAWHIGDGMTYLYNGDQKQFTDNFWATVDYYRLPGITVAKQEHEVKCLEFGSGNEGVLYADGYKSPHSWVGGSSLENAYGIVGMWFSDEKSSLTAKKSWFMVGDQIACLGAGINSSDNYTIETVVDHRKISEAPYRITLDNKQILPKVGTEKAASASWVHLDSDQPETAIGYYFPQGSNVHVMRETRTGAWSDFSKYGRFNPETREYFTMWYDHGKRPKEATYAYVLLPGMKLADMNAYAQKPSIQILANTPQVQAAEDTQTGVVGINFWQANTVPVAGITVNEPASVMVSKQNGEITIGVSDPTQLLKGAIILQTDFAVGALVRENPNVKVLETSPKLKLEVKVEGGHGKTFPVTFKL